MGRRAYLSALAAGLAGASAGCGSGGGPDNHVRIYVRGTDVTADVAVERVSDGAVLLSETVTLQRLGTEEGGPNQRYGDVFGTDRVDVRFDARDGPERGREFDLGEGDAGVSIRYDGSIDFEVDESVSYR